MGNFLDNSILDVQTSTGPDVQLVMFVMHLNLAILKRELDMVVDTMNEEMLSMLREKNQTMSLMNMDARKRNSGKIHQLAVKR